MNATSVAGHKKLHEREKKGNKTQGGRKEADTRHTRTDKQRREMLNSTLQRTFAIKALLRKQD